MSLGRSLPPLANETWGPQAKEQATMGRGGGDAASPSDVCFIIFGLEAGNVDEAKAVFNVRRISYGPRDR